MHPEASDMEEFLNDRLFRAWVSRPTPDLEEYWEGFLMANPHKKETFEKARECLLQIRRRVESDYPDESVVENIYQGIENRIGETYVFLSAGRRRVVWMAASILIGLVGLGLWFNMYSHAPLDYTELVEKAETELKEYVNNTAGVLPVRLPDGSSVHLNPGSKISYPKQFWGNGKREVYLDGSAFFQVTECITHPFYVYYEELITRVLGTSFHINSSPEKAEVTIAVVTGKVSVSTRDRFSKGKKDEMLLTPNQQALFEKKTTSFRKSLVANPVMISNAVSKEEFEFDETPASKIFTTIEKSYGVQVSYDERILGNCLLTASLSEESLFEKMDLICMALGARYFVEGTRIVVTGTGCPE